MAAILYLNSSNIVAGTNNSVLRYKLTSNPFAGKDRYEIALAKTEMYNSIFNISDAYNNNTFSYYWLNSTGVIDTNTKYTVVIPNGMYNTDQLNQFFMSAMIANKHYLVSTYDSNALTFFYSFTNNLSVYRVQLNAFKFLTREVVNTGGSTNLPYNYPSGATWQLPTTGSRLVGSIYFPNNNFGKLMGFNSNQTLPALGTVSDNMQILGNTAPAQLPSSSILFSSNIVKNQLSYPDNILHSIALDDSFGSLIVEEPNNLLWLPVAQGSYDSIQISMQDQDFRPVSIQDPQMLLTLVLRKLPPEAEPKK